MQLTLSDWCESQYCKPSCECAAADYGRASMFITAQHCDEIEHARSLSLCERELSHCMHRATVPCSESVSGALLQMHISHHLYLSLAGPTGSFVLSTSSSLLPAIFSSIPTLLGSEVSGRRHLRIALVGPSPPSPAFPAVESFRRASGS